MHPDVTIVLMPETADPQAAGLSTVLGVENASRSERNLERVSKIPPERDPEARKIEERIVDGK
jgi:hypothetical protein